MSETLVFDKESGTLTRVRIGVFRWPSWNWQRGGLFASIFLGIILLTSPSPLRFIGLLLLAAGLYGGFKTRWLNDVDGASPLAKASCGFAVASGLITIAMVMIAVAIVGILLYLMLLILGFVFGALLGGFGNNQKG